MSTGVARTPASTIALTTSARSDSDGAGHTVGFAPLALRDQRGVDRNERRRQRAFAEQILQKVGDAERRAEGVGFDAEAEVVREDALSDQAGQPRQQDAGRDEERGAARRGRSVQMLPV